ncbi:PgpB Membrane-associated phospholipid phosphatase [Candidatus Nanopelagicaceae bacterium]
MSNPLLTLDTSISRVLNNWGAREIFLVKVLSEYLVFVVIAFALLWLVHRTYQSNSSLIDFNFFFRNLFIQGVAILVLPVGLATVISEVISRFYIRQRPFAAMSDIKLLVPHSADGGMPSHHMVFMVSIAMMFYHFSKKLGIAFIVLSLISGIARISAGLHYPSDVLAGALVGGVLAIAYARTVLKGRHNLSNLK